MSSNVGFVRRLEIRAVKPPETGVERFQRYVKEHPKTTALIAVALAAIGASSVLGMGTCYNAVLNGATAAGQAATTAATSAAASVQAYAGQAAEGAQAAWAATAGAVASAAQSVKHFLGFAKEEQPIRFFPPPFFG